MDIFSDMPSLFPLMRGGGAFLVLIGLGIVAGSVGSRRSRIVALIVGAGLGVIVMAVGGATKLIFAGVGSPEWWHWVVLAVAFVVEGYLVSVVVRRFPDLDSREFWMWMLFIVGAHFLILGFSHGPICAILALVCMANALIGLRARSVPVGAFWAIDGLLKVAAGVIMVAVSFG